jgi:hypothetical protein
MEIKHQPTINGLGLFATKKYTKNEVIYVLEGIVSEHPARETIHIGNNQHILDKYGMYMNHSFEPTTWINGKNVIAVRNIEIGEELTFNYNQTELKMANPFVVNGVMVCGKEKS